MSRREDRALLAFAVLVVLAVLLARWSDPGTVCAPEVGSDAGGPERALSAR